MKKRLNGRIRAILIIAIALAVVTAVTSAVFGTTFLRQAVQTVLTPVRSGISSITRQIERYYDYIFGYEALEAENKYLEERIMKIERDIRNADVLQRENDRLNELLNMQKSNPDYQYCDAYIVSWDSSNWKSTFSIAKGTNSGLEEGMVVVTEYNQVIGMITAIGPNWATVTTILDTTLEVSASITSSGHTGVVQGTFMSGEESTLRMNYLPTDIVLRNGDQVVTTGSEVYPKNLIIGYISDAGYDETGVAKYATLIPAADFQQLEQVFVITHFSVE